jgi:hypothetical protein
MASTLDQTIDAHRGGGRGGWRARGAPHVPPQKTLKNCNIKMQHNTKIEGPLPDYFTTPCTPSKEFENDCASMDQTCKCSTSCT